STSAENRPLRTHCPPTFRRQAPPCLQTEEKRFSLPQGERCSKANSPLPAAALLFTAGASITAGRSSSLGPALPATSAGGTARASCIGANTSSSAFALNGSESSAPRLFTRSFATSTSSGAVAVESTATSNWGHRSNQPFDPPLTIR
ncbi:MAG: hypothetical protein BJ554DRAFT_4654, partial [Olpidium bornovanus]